MLDLATLTVLNSYRWTLKSGHPTAMVVAARGLHNVPPIVSECPTPTSAQLPTAEELANWQDKLTKEASYPLKPENCSHYAKLRGVCVHCGTEDTDPAPDEYDVYPGMSLTELRCVRHVLRFWIVRERFAGGKHGWASNLLDRLEEI